MDHVAVGAMVVLAVAICMVVWMIWQFPRGPK